MRALAAGSILVFHVWRIGSPRTASRTISAASARYRRLGTATAASVEPRRDRGRYSSPARSTHRRKSPTAPSSSATRRSGEREDRRAEDASGPRQDGTTRRRSRFRTTPRRRRTRRQRRGRARSHPRPCRGQPPRRRDCERPLDCRVVAKRPAGCQARTGATLASPGRARSESSGSLNPKSAPAGRTPSEGGGHGHGSPTRGVDSSGPAHWERSNRVRSGRKQR